MTLLRADGCNTGLEAEPDDSVLHLSSEVSQWKLDLAVGPPRIRQTICVHLCRWLQCLQDRCRYDVDEEHLCLSSEVIVHDVFESGFGLFACALA
jgi:hypothetical protein